jgi:hypothetical protein
MMAPPTATPMSPSSAPPTTAAPSALEAVPCVRSNAGDVIAGADLRASFDRGSSRCEYKALLIESVTRINATFQFDTFGSFALRISNCSGVNETILSNVITVACGGGLRLSSGRCEPTNTTCGLDEVRIGPMCKKPPHLRLLSDAQAIFDTVPNPAESTGSVRLLPMQLVLEGGFDVEWRVSVSAPGAAKWLAFQPVAEQVPAPDGPTRVVNATLVLNVSEQKDFSFSGDLNSTLVIESRIPSKPDIAFEGQSIMIPVRVRVKAQACVTLQDVQVEIDASGRRSFGSAAYVEGIEPKSSVVIHVRAYDCRRNPINRSLAAALDDYPLRLRLRDSGSDAVLDGHLDTERVIAYAPTETEKNLYRATLPQSWVNSTGKVQLVVFAGEVNGTCSLSLTLVLAPNSFPVFTVVGAVIGVGLFVLLLCLLGILRKNRAAVKQTIKAYMKFEFRLGVEMSTPLGSRRQPSAGSSRCSWLYTFITGVDALDLVGDTVVVVDVHRNRSELAIWYGLARACGRQRSAALV